MFKFNVVFFGQYIVNDAGRATTCRRQLKGSSLHKVYKKRF